VNKAYEERDAHLRDAWKQPRRFNGMEESQLPSPHMRGGYLGNPPGGITGGAPVHSSDPLRKDLTAEERTAMVEKAHEDRNKSLENAWKNGGAK
jgi:hypothetical protein